MSITHRRYEVFIGSPFHGLKEVRESLRDAILRAGHFPCGTELWAASPYPTTDVILSYLNLCDIHLLVLGATYGSIVTDAESPEAAKRQISFTEWEFEESLRASRPVIAFIMHEDASESLRSHRFKKKVAQEPSGAYERFRKRLQDKRLYMYFEDTKEGRMALERDCVIGLHTFGSGRLARDLANRGWIRASSAEGKNLSAIRESPILQEVIDRISKFDVLARRMNEQPTAKRMMAWLFWAHMQRRVRDWCQEHSRNTKLKRDDRPMQVFFESGSTIVYLAKRFEEYIVGCAGRHEDWRIRTNNIVCLLQFDLFTPNDARCYPDGKPDPEDKYGAIFPAPWGILERPPHSKPTGASDPEKRAVKAALASFNAEDGAPRTFVFAAASGWDTDHKYREFRGPHVGSYKNKLFKRVLFDAGSPVVIFIDAVKFGSPRGKQCYSVFGSDPSLKGWLAKRPIALCIGWEAAAAPGKQGTTDAVRFEPTEAEPKPSRDSLRKHLQWIRSEITRLDLGFDMNSLYFDHEEPPGGDDSWAGAFMVGNKCFLSEVPVSAR